jgi:hypothetical protein
MQKGTREEGVTPSGAPGSEEEALEARTAEKRAEGQERRRSRIRSQDLRRRRWGPERGGPRPWGNAYGDQRALRMRTQEGEGFRIRSGSSGLREKGRSDRGRGPEDCSGSGFGRLVAGVEGWGLGRPW